MGSRHRPPKDERDKRLPPSPGNGALIASGNPGLDVEADDAASCSS
jgi:hypothetical protein